MFPANVCDKFGHAVERFARVCFEPWNIIDAVFVARKSLKQRCSREFTDGFVCTHTGKKNEKL